MRVLLDMIVHGLAWTAVWASFAFIGAIIVLTLVKTP